MSRHSFQNTAGQVWNLSAEGTTLIEGTTRTRFENYTSLFAEAEKRIGAKKKRGFRLAGDLAARAAGTLNHVTAEHIEKVRRQFGPRQSIWTDPWSELDEVLQDPSGYDGGVLLFDGDAKISGSWDAGDYAAVVVLGDCVVEGLLYQFETEPWLIVTGDLVAGDLVMAGNLDVGGSIRARRSAEFESALGYTHAGGEITAPTLFVWDMPVTSKSVVADLLVARGEPTKAVFSENVETGSTLNVLLGEGAQLAKTFHPCILEGNANEVTFSSEHRSDLVHILGLPLRSS